MKLGVHSATFVKNWSEDITPYIKLCSDAGYSSVEVSLLGQNIKSAMEIGELSKDPITGVAEVDIIPLYWALAIGCGFGGNATPIGSSANVMTIANSERGGHKISTKE